MEVMIGLILLLCILFAVGYVLRRRIYKEVDRLEAWKIEIMNRSIVNELSKVKELKMIGQAEELFDQWRYEWDEIITKQLPEVEELLYDAEEYCDKYRFKKSKEVLQHIEKVLVTVNENIDNIIEEINELVSSEEKNAIEGEEIKGQFKKLKKTLLAHSHQFGPAHSKLEENLAEIYEQMKEFDTETNEGNYLSARKIVIALQSQLDSLQEKINDIPKLLTECNITLPNLLNELEKGYEEMKESGYYLEHIQVQAEIQKINKQLEVYRKQLAETDIVDLNESLQGIQSSIDAIYDLLEKEVEANHFVLSAKEKINDKLVELTEQKLATVEETELVKQSYQLSETELDKQKQLDKQISQVEKKFVHILQNLTNDQIAHSIIKEELEDVENQISKLFNEHNQYREMLQMLRKDELQAREKLSHFKRILLETSRSVHQSNIPGLPSDYADLIDAAKRKVLKVSAKLDEIPLNMMDVNHLLDEAVQSIEQLQEVTDELIEQVYLIEQIIQYGNRYRSRSQHLAEKFVEAENLFREYNFSQSLETAAAALEKVEPGSLNKIQSILNEEKQ